MLTGDRVVDLDVVDLSFPAADPHSGYRGQRAGGALLFIAVPSFADGDAAKRCVDAPKIGLPAS